MKRIILLFTVMVCFLSVEAQEITKMEGKVKRSSPYVDLESNAIIYPRTTELRNLQLYFRFEITNGNLDLNANDTIIISGRIGNQTFFDDSVIIILDNALAAGATMYYEFPDEVMGLYLNVLTTIDDTTTGTLYGKVNYASHYTPPLPLQKSLELRLIKEQQGTDPEDNIAETAMSKVKIYPNPVISDLKITNLKNTNIEIYNIVGQRVSHLEDVSGDISVDMKIFPDGIYFVKLKNGNAIRTERIKLVK
jgi:hypothetical protein